MTVAIYVIVAVGLIDRFGQWTSRQAAQVFVSIGMSVDNVRLEGRNKTDMESVRTCLY